MVITLTCDSDFSSVGRSVAAGKVVIFPTDTVYGLGSNPLSDRGVAKCFELKKRDFGRHLPVLFDSMESVSKFVEFDDLAQILAREFWPGNLTLILHLKEIRVPTRLADVDRSLAVRIPNHQCCLRLISNCGGALIGTSANLTDTASFTEPEDASLFEFARNADFFLKGACGKEKRPSTIVKLSRRHEISVVRDGALPTKKILDYLRKMRFTDFSFKNDAR